MTGGYGHYNICVFHDAHCTPENAKLYLEAWDHGALRDLKEKIGANDEELRRMTCSQLRRAIHICTVLSPFSVSSCIVQGVDILASRI